MGRSRAYSVGDRKNKWTVIGEFDEAPRYLCRCDCGTEKRLRSPLSSGSCGCQRGALLRENYANKRKRGIYNWARKHGLSQTREYRSWKHAINRCHNPNNDGFHLYGARGIVVCEQWLGDKGFEQFLKDMGERPPKTSLDRIDPNGNYEPNNCRWADDKTQIANRRTVVQISLDRLRRLEAFAASHGEKI